MLAGTVRKIAEDGWADTVLAALAGPYVDADSMIPTAVRPQPDAGTTAATG